MLQTERLKLIPAVLPMLEATVAEDWQTLHTILGINRHAEHWLHFPEAMVWMRDFLQEFDADANWWNYFIVHLEDQCLIGTCGYKGPPAVDSEVEIGYEIAEAYQGRGLATEAARALVERAFSFPEVAIVSAHTLAEENASVSLLRKLNFQFMGEHTDMEDGNLWSWQRGRE